MPLILVTPLSVLPDVLRAYRPSHLISLLSPEFMSHAPSDFPQDRHLKLGLHDLSEPQDGKVVADEIHVTALLGFGRGWDGAQPMVVHCWAGVSRSMATAFSILCDRAGRGEEARIAADIRARAPYAQPNPLIVRHADTLLGRNGAMIRAIADLGPAVEVAEGVPVAFPLEDVAP